MPKIQWRKDAIKMQCNKDSPHQRFCYHHMWIFRYPFLCWQSYTAPGRPQKPKIGQKIIVLVHHLKFVLASCVDSWTPKRYLFCVSNVSNVSNAVLSVSNKPVLTALRPFGLGKHCTGWQFNSTPPNILLGGISVGWPLWTWNGWDGSHLSPSQTPTNQPSRFFDTSLLPYRNGKFKIT